MMSHFKGGSLRCGVCALMFVLIAMLLHSCAGLPKDTGSRGGDKTRKHARIIGKGGAEEDFSKDKDLAYLKIFEEGVKQLKSSSKKALEAAKLRFQEVLLKKKSFWPAHYNLAYISYIQKKYEEADAHIDNALKYKKEDIHIYTLLGAVYYAEEEYSRAYDLYDEMAEYYEDVTVAFYQMGNILMLEKKYEEALNLYNKIGKVEERHFPVFYNKATCYLELGRFEEASKSLKYVYDLGIRDNYLLKQYAYSLRKEGHLEKAVAMYDELLLFFPEEVEAYKNAGVIYELYLDEPAKAIPYYEKYIFKHGKDYEHAENWLSVARDKTKRRSE